MKVTLKLLPAVMLLLLACGSSSEEAGTTKGSTASTTSSADDLELPEEVNSLLARQYPGWRQPVLVAEVQKLVQNKKQGPLLVKGQFDDDNTQDLALQIRHEEQVLMLAFTQQDSAWQLHELKKDILFNERGNLKSLYYLYLAEPGTSIRNTETNKVLKTAKEAIAIGLDNQVNIFLYEGGQFIAYEAED
ncbi:hypothetical protein ACMA1I_04740 [Pontibacter sp. 13R65]|uniref:hypothetical protein n=1 Tax=Pontibacter sp. 13R65 TaxID=3127458 RepID=UPI00301CAAA5